MQESGNIKVRGSTLLTEKVPGFEAIKKLTQWGMVTPLELKLYILSQNDKNASQENNCSICQCELFDKLNEESLQKIAADQASLVANVQKGNTKDITAVVKLGNCDYFHAFHADCVEGHFNATSNGNQFYKCPVCERISGVRVGEMPAGTMSWSFDPNMRIGGAAQAGGFSINYSMQSGMKNGVRYQGTSRQAFLPACNEGKETLALLVEAFRRKLTFIVGTSQTTGQTNCVCWAGIHHKTNPQGGTFGWPDPTYFQRVRSELQARGVELTPQIMSSVNINQGTVKVT